MVKEKDSNIKSMFGNEDNTVDHIRGRRISYDKNIEGKLIFLPDKA